MKKQTAIDRLACIANEIKMDEGANHISSILFILCSSIYNNNVEKLYEVVVTFEKSKQHHETAERQN